MQPPCHVRRLAVAATAGWPSVGVRGVAVTVGAVGRADAGDVGAAEVGGIDDGGACGAEVGRAGSVAAAGAVVAATAVGALVIAGSVLKEVVSGGTVVGDVEVAVAVVVVVGDDVGGGSETVSSTVPGGADDGVDASAGTAGNAAMHAPATSTA